MNTINGTNDELGVVNSYFGSGSSQDLSTIECRKCHKLGHKERFCPNKVKDPKKPRPAPKVKKFWCALHRDDRSKGCSSVNCTELRKIEVNKRIEMLKVNGDCAHCCGDHKSADCN